MKCVKCGKELQPGALFCIYCGTRAAEPETAAPTAEAAVPPTPEAPTEKTAPVTPIEENVPEVETPAATELVTPPTYQEPVQQQYQQPAQQQYQQPAQQQYQQPVQQQYQQPTYQQPTYQQQPVQQPAPKKKKTGLIAVLIVVIVLLIIAAAAVVAIVFLKNKNATASNDRQLSYVKNDKLYYVKDVTKDGDPFVVSSVKNAEDYKGSGLSGTFSADGSYLYFYSKIENSTSGKLSRVEVSKLKADEDKNEKLIEDLASGVSSYTLLDNERFIYENDSNELYYYDGEDKNKITSGVSSYYLGEDDSVYFTISDVSDEWLNDIQFGCYSIADNETTMLIDNCSYIVAEVQDGWFYAVYDSEDYRYDLYYSSKDGKQELVASDTYNISGATAADSTVYYVTQRAENVCYYDLVNDPYAEEDAAVTQPSALNYLTACTEYDAMSDWDREYYANYPDEIGYFYDWLFADTNYGTGMLYYYSYHVDEAGNYIYAYYFYDEAATQWYAFDMDSYNAACEAYNAVAERITLREALQAETTDITYYDLNAWTPGNGQSVVASGIGQYTSSLIGETGIVTYQKYGELGKVDWPEDIYDTWFVSDYISECLYGDGEQYYYNYKGTENAWNSEWGDLSAGISFDSSSDGTYAVGYTYTYDEDYNDVISINMYEVKDGSLSLIEGGISVTDVGFWQDDSYYYFVSDSDGEGNLCCFADGKSTTVLKNISNAGVKRYDNGSYTAFSDYNYTDGGTLKLFSADGESTKIASGVRSYCYIEDGLIVYISDEKLYVYRGEDEDKSKIDSSVTSFTCNGAGYETLLY